jgi:hypothetical protein
MTLAIERREMLALPGRVTATALELPAGLSFGEWTDVGRTLQAIERSVLWWIGDWLRYGEAAWGEQYAQGIDESPYSYQSLRDAAWVSGKFQLSRRRDNCSWSHHKEVAALDPVIADRLLDLTVEHSWSTRQLRQEVNQLRNVVGALPCQDTCSIADLWEAAAGGRKFGTIYADPPWRPATTTTP